MSNGPNTTKINGEERVAYEVAVYDKYDRRWVESVYVFGPICFNADRLKEHYPDCYFRIRNSGRKAFIYD
jgi:hypothetical protein